MSRRRVGLPVGAGAVGAGAVGAAGVDGAAGLDFGGVAVGGVGGLVGAGPLGRMKRGLVAGTGIGVGGVGAELGADSSSSSEITRGIGGAASAGAVTSAGGVAFPTTVAP